VPDRRASSPAFSGRGRNQLVTERTARCARLVVGPLPFIRTAWPGGTGTARWRGPCSAIASSRGCTRPRGRAAARQMRSATRPGGIGRGLDRWYGAPRGRRTAAGGLRLSCLDDVDGRENHDPEFMQRIGLSRLPIAAFRIVASVGVFVAGRGHGVTETAVWCPRESTGRSLLPAGPLFLICSSLVLAGRVLETCVRCPVKPECLTSALRTCELHAV